MMRQRLPRRWPKALLVMGAEKLSYDAPEIVLTVCIAESPVCFVDEEDVNVGVWLMWFGRT